MHYFALVHKSKVKYDKLEFNMLKFGHRKLCHCEQTPVLPSTPRLITCYYLKKTA